MLRILLSAAAIEESDEDKPGVILDEDKDGNVVGLEILEASKRISNPRSAEYAVAGWWRMIPPHRFRCVASLRGRRCRRLHDPPCQPASSEILNPQSLIPRQRPGESVVGHVGFFVAALIERCYSKLTHDRESRSSPGSYVVGRMF